MDRNKRNSSAERLLDVIGMIDDSIIAETEKNGLQRIHRGTSLSIKRFIAVAATLALVMTVALGGFLVAEIAKVSSDGLAEDFDNAVNDNLTGGVSKALELDCSLTSANSKLTKTVPVEQIDFFDGVASLIWQREGESEYHVVAFDGGTEKSDIKKMMSEATMQMDEASSSGIECKVWVSYGNGEVVSPYLKDSAGNVGYGELFDYSPEVVPSDSFTRLVDRTVSN